MHPRYQHVALALALATCGLVPLLESCNGGGGSVAASTGSGGAGGSSGNGLFSDGGVGTGSFSFPDACSGPDASDAVDGATGCEGLEGGVTYQQAGAILASCTGEICHAPPTASSLVGVTAYECCDGRALVQPGNAAQSYLLDKVAGHDICQGARMPLDGTPLSAADTLTLTRWICEGAPAN